MDDDHKFYRISKRCVLCIICSITLYQYVRSFLQSLPGNGAAQQELCKHTIHLVLCCRELLLSMSGHRCLQRYIQLHLEFLYLSINWMSTRIGYSMKYNISLVCFGSILVVIRQRNDFKFFLLPLNYMCLIHSLSLIVDIW